MKHLGELLVAIGHWLSDGSSVSYTTDAEVQELHRARAPHVIEAEGLPTFDNVWGCLDCGLIQSTPKRLKCSLCRSGSLISLVLQLRRGSERIAKRRLPRHQEVMRMRN